MINSTDFSSRLKKVMEYYQLTSSLFADKVGVQRSSISHILSGRNKPSLDFVLKVTHTFTEIDIHWLLNGKGNFPSTPTLEKTERSFASKAHYNDTHKKKIQRIVVFYEDGTFDEFNR